MHWLLKTAVATTLLSGSASAGMTEDYKENKQVSRLPALTEPFDPIVKEMFDRRKALGGSVINLSLTQAHAPKIAKAQNTVAFALRFDAVTPRSLRELAIMRTAQIAGSQYELNQHTPMMKMCGYSEQQIKDIATWQKSTLFDEKQRALLAYVEQMAHGGDVDDPTFANLSKQFSAQEIMEITFTVSNYYGTALLTRALRIQIEDDGRLTATGNCEGR
jgi:alkylhydroperoxidase family enzyme